MKEPQSQPKISRYTCTCNSILLLSPFLRLSLLSLFPILSLMLVCYTPCACTCKLTVRASACSVHGRWVHSIMLSFALVHMYCTCTGVHTHVQCTLSYTCTCTCTCTCIYIGSGYIMYMYMYMYIYMFVLCMTWWL